ncbi:MAG: murein L,D-transpeptidase catalytic domain family protein [Tannerella sp.]|nr:murein L,D-transpeptidase catalytic domain family protein [Tannerella sp.]
MENHPEKDTLIARLKLKADSALAYCRDNGFSEKYCFLIDFGIHSGKNRFFIWDFEKDTVVRAGLCAHGYGGNSTQSRPEYSNAEGSYCSSQGRYKTGISSYSQWGIHTHYKLHGLEPTNSNAFKRIVVLHSYKYVPDAEIYPLYLPLGYSAGCPVVSNTMMRAADTLLKNSDRPFLLWIFDEMSGQ